MRAAKESAIPSVIRDPNESMGSPRKTKCPIPAVRGTVIRAAPIAPARVLLGLVLAQSFRDKLYENPQSLSAVLTVTAVRENNALQGYRVSPGKNSEQFSQLGFKAGDVITGVNGISLDNPANTMRLYQVMRTADEAVFDLQRDGESHSFSVSLNEAADGG